MQPIDLHNINDEDLFSMLQELGFSPGPIVDTTRDFYKKKVIEKMKGFGEFDNGNTLNEITMSDHPSDCSALHETSEHDATLISEHSTSQESESGIDRSNLSSPATERAMRLAMLQQSLSSVPQNELQHRVKNTGMYGLDESFRQLKRQPIRQPIIQPTRPPNRQPIPTSGRLRTLTPGRSAMFEKYWDEKRLQAGYANNPVPRGRAKSIAGNKILLLIKIMGLMILMFVMYYIWQTYVDSDLLLIDKDENPTLEDDAYDFDSLLK